MIAYDVPLDFPAGSILVEAVTTTKARPGQPVQTKTRRLSCACLTVLAAKGLHPGESHSKPVDDGKSAAAIPFLTMIAGSYNQVQAVAANLRSGRRAQLMTGPTVDGYVELAPKAGYRTHTVRAADGTSVLTLYLPWAVQAVPQERPESRVSIANLIPRTWLREEAGKLAVREGLAEAEAQQAAIAAWVVHRIDKAISRPILADLEFRRFLFGKLRAENGGLLTFGGFSHRSSTMCWPKGSDVIWAHASAVVAPVASLNSLVEEATRDWVGKRGASGAAARQYGAQLGAAVSF